ncbi:MAG TPA: HAD family hydrolase [Clostridiales bacterium]|nr:HAD family hydrolase [Clostridiales bacterium]
MGKKLYIFDFDGTLVDTITDVAICFNAALAQFGFPIHDLALYKHFVGGNLETVVARLLPPHEMTEENITKVKTVYRELYLASDKPNTAPFSGITEVLLQLQKNQKKLTIHTNKAQQLTDALCQRFFGQIDFLAVVGYDPLYPSKPDPWGVRYLMEKARVTAEETLYIGDGLTDVLTAENAGIDCLYVTWGQGKQGDTDHSCVRFIAEKPQDIMDYEKGTK